jgi:hypothetical protein
MTNANRKNQIPLSDKMIQVLSTLPPVRMSNGANATGFKITVVGMAVLANRREAGVAS